MPKQTATWNTARDAWEKPGAVDLTCGHSAVYSATFPTSGSMRNGVAYELPTWEPATPDTGSLSLLRTVMAAEADGGPLSPAMAKHRGQTLRLSGQMIDLVAPGQLKQPPLLPTVTTQDAANTGGPSQFKRNTPPLNTRVLMLPKPTEPDTNTDGVKLLPTPVAQHSGNTPENHLRKKPGREVVTDLAILTENGLLPTGGRMPQPSVVGNAPSADQLPGQLSLLDVMEESA